MTDRTGNGGRTTAPSMILAGTMLLAVPAACTDPGQGNTSAGAEASGTGIASLGPVTDGATSRATGPDTVDDTAGLRLDVGSMFDMLAGDSSSDEECDALTATIRDFQASHPDFESYAGDVASVGLVLPTLGPDQRPVYNPAYAGAPMITSEATFEQWYQDVPGTNMPFPIDLELTEETPGEFSFDSDAFFPLDGMGFGDEGNPHNFHFTTEVHTSFTYQGGEVFTFRGDDDLWMFVDGQLAIDLGGLHPALEASVEMDGLGLEPGETYAMDIFHAERHTTASNFRIVTTIECFVSPPPPA